MLEQTINEMMVSGKQLKPKRKDKIQAKTTKKQRNTDIIN